MFTFRSTLVLTLFTAQESMFDEEGSMDTAASPEETVKRQ